FREKFSKKFDAENITPLEMEFGLSLTNFVGFAQGQVTFIVFQNGWDGKSGPLPSWLLLIDSKDKSNLLKTNLTELKKQWTESRRPIKATKIRDVEFTVLAAFAGATNGVDQTSQKAKPAQEAGNSTNSRPAQPREWLMGQ